MSNQISLLDWFKIELDNKKSFLDVGCGYGKSCDEIKTLIPHLRVVGLDIVEKFINYAKRNFPGCEYFLGDGRKLPFKKDEFDVAFTHGFLIHVPHKDIKKTIKKIMTVAKSAIFVESSGEEKKGKMKYDPKEYWNGRARRSKPNKADKETQYYFSHNYMDIFNKLKLKGVVFYSFHDEANTRIYICRR